MQPVKSPPLALPTLLSLAGAKLLVHLATLTGYGVFRDEFYYIACGRHLSWGYVEFPPLIAVAPWILSHLSADIAPALRALSALAGAALVLLTGVIARELGANRFGQGCAALAVIVAPVWLSLHHLYTPNGFEPLFWSGCAWLLIRIVKTGNPALWLWFGLLAGAGLMNKTSTLFWGFGVVVGLLLTKERRWLREPRFWLGGLIAVALVLPNALWQARHGFPLIEFLRNAESGKNYIMTPLEFFGSQATLLHPVTLPLWLGGLAYLFFGGGGRYRLLAWAYLAIFGVLVALHGKAYYPIPAYPMLLAAGAAAWERVIVNRHWNRLKPATLFAMATAGALTAPLALPVLRVETFIRYARFIGIGDVKSENHKMGRLPQLYADMFGWEEMAASVAKAYQSLTDEEKPRAVIFTQNYGQAGALEYYGRRYGLPRVISRHNSYFLWGPGTLGPDTVLLVIGGNPEEARALFANVQQGGFITHEYAMPYESGLPVWVCRGPRVNLNELWPMLKHYI